MKNLKRIIPMIIVCISVISMLNNIVSAESTDYTLEGSRRIPIPKTYVLNNVIFNLGVIDNEPVRLKKPEDIYISEEGYLFIADTGNNRVIKLTKEGKLVNIFKGPDDKPLNNPQGIFVETNGNIFIADTGNSRILHLSASGKYIEEFTKPESDLIDEDLMFQPVKVAVSPTGYLYVIKGEAIMMMDAYSRFRGYIGQSDIGFRLLDVILRTFASEEQKRAIRKRIAAPYLNITLDKNGAIYATTKDIADGEIKKLNSIGENIYRNYAGLQSEFKLLDLSSLTSLTLANRSFIFGERFDDENNPIKPNFIDIAVDKNGIISVVEDQTGKIYQYDQEGNLLTVFGGKSDQKGWFSFPSSICVDNDGNIYVLDRVLNNIQVFKPTKFIKLVHEAVVLYSNGEYEEAYNKWMEVMAIDENYQLARAGIANTLFKQQDWEGAMAEYKQAEDREGYSKAFVKYRYDIFRKNFPLVVIGMLIVLSLMYFIAIGILKISNTALSEIRESRNKRFNTFKVLKFSFSILTHPIETFELIKQNRANLNYIPSIFILIMLVAVRVFYIYTVHYPLADVDPKNANIYLEMISLLLPVLTWILASYAITSIMGGESKLGEIFVSSTYCMLPYIVISLPLSLLSNILARTEIGMHTFIINFSRLWILTLFFTSVKTLNDYKISKTVGVCAVSLITVALIWGVALLMLVLTGQLYEFFLGLFREAQLVF